MTENTEHKIRTFVYNGQSFKDPGSDFTIDDVRAQLATHYPEVASAKIVETENDDGTMTVEFVKQVGTKGRDLCNIRGPAALDCCGCDEPNHVIEIRPVVLNLDDDGTTYEATYMLHCPHCRSSIDAARRICSSESRKTIDCPACTKPIELSVVHVTIYMIRKLA